MLPNACMRIDRPLGGAVVPGATFRRARFCAARRSTGHREPVAVVGCISLLMMYSPIWLPLSVPTRVEKPVGSGTRPRCGRSQSRRQRHRGWVQRCATPGAVKLVIKISGMSVEPSTDSMRATAALLSMQCAHGYSGCSGVLSIGSQVARVSSPGCGRGRRCGSRLRGPGAAAALEPLRNSWKAAISVRFAV